jgi:hypothetical protein
VDEKFDKNTDRGDAQKYVSGAGKNIRDTAVRSEGSVGLRLYNGQKVVN